MKVSVNWLKQLVKVDLSVDELSHTLTMAGLEVEEQTPVAAEFSRVVVAKVLTVAPHPNADKLRITEVDVGAEERLQIVCGAPNVAVGMRVPCALVGAVLPGFEIKAAKLRGIDSNGMLCSAKELGISDANEGLLALPADAPIGQDIREYLDLDDVVLTIKMTPNRGDCLSMIGIARDLAAVTGAKLRLPGANTVTATGDLTRAVAIAAPAACGHYLGRVITNINAKASVPGWMRQRLERGGFRSISPLVDITNYLTLERGRPMHAFDNDKLNGGICVRFPAPGEIITLLNDQETSFVDDVLLIADEAGPVAIAGVMGGLASSVTSSTTNIFFEAAYFDPDIIQGKTRWLGINSDAAFRFERGVDPASARAGMEYATQLAIEICGTAETRVGPLTEAKGQFPPQAPVLVRPDRVRAIIGMPVANAEMIDVFKRLDCQVIEEALALQVTAPSYRFDLKIEADFAEEVARIVGYERVPATPPRAGVPMVAVSEAGRSKTQYRRATAALGYQEVINYSFVPAEWENGLMANTNPVRVANSIASQMSVMRTSLLGGPIQTLQYNLNRGETRLKLFEIGRCFLSAEADVANQPERLAGLAYGARFPEQWGEDKAASADFFAVKGEVESLLAGLPVSFKPLQHAALHPGRSAAILMADEPVGWLGELHPRWQQHFELPLAPLAFEFDLAKVLYRRPLTYAPISRMQSVRRDVAFLVSENVAIDQISEAFWGSKPANVVDFGLFDLYRGAALGFGQKSLAFRIVMQDTERTLTDVECDKIVSDFVEVMSNKFGASLRK